MKLAQIMMIVSTIAYIISVIVVAQLHGEDFKYNMTKEMEQETRLLDICIYTDIKIPNCNELYGGLNKTYGEYSKSK